MNNNKLKELLKAYQNGSCSEHEREIVEAWLNSTTSEAPDSAAVTAHLQRAKGEITQHIKTSRKVVALHSYRIWFAVAAALLVFSSIYYLTFRVTVGSKPGTELVKSLNPHLKPANQWVYISTPKAKKYRVRLSDGSIVVMNASSKLRYPARFVGNKRPVYLDEGEALFEVTKDKTRPFTVYTSRFSTTALGTAFNIRSYSKEHKVSISLIHGKIKVVDLVATRQKRFAAILLPHQQIMFNKQTGSIADNTFHDEDGITGWKDGIISFHDATADEVLNAVENRFGIAIINHCANKEWSYTGTFKNESLNEVLSTICLTEGMKYKVNQHTITLN